MLLKLNFLQILNLMKKNKKINFKKVLLIISIILVLFFALFMGFICYIYNKYDLDKSKLTSLNNGIIVASAKSDDENLYNTNRSIVEIETLPKYVLDAFVDIEDKRFYTHNGYDIKRIVKAGFVNLKSKNKSQGASTISQQLVKNALLSNEKTYSRKIQEIVLASKIEKEFSKDQILEMYLNTIYFGSNAYGIENASHIYFNKSAKDLTLNEACCLAGLIKSPYHYSPKVNYNNSIKRRNLVAKSMLELNHISKEEYDNVVSSEINLENTTSFDYSYEEEAIFEACKLLGISERDLINQEYQIISNKDVKLQEKVLEITNQVLSNYPNSDSLTIVMDNQGKIVSYYANSKYDLHNAKCQVASTLKPLAVYLPCIQHNILTPVSQILDEPIDYSGFKPKNADGKFHGYISTREALAHSLNIPAVKLLECVGIEKSKQTLSTLGLNISKEDENLSIALGSTKNGIKPIDLISAYSTLANMGVYHAPTFIDKIYDKNKNLVYSNQNYSEQVLKENDCFILNEMLKDSAKYGTAKRLNELNIAVSSKTGTNSINGKNTDILNVSYTTEHTILTWITNIKNKHLDEKMLSSVEPTEINKQTLSYIYNDHKPKDFTLPEGIEYLPYNLKELQNNRRLISPSSQLSERYIAYDYFKSDFKPAQATIDSLTKPIVNVTKHGAKISFYTENNNDYVLYRIINNQTEIVSTEYSENYEFIDKNIFEYDEISYFYSCNGEKSESVTIRPKDYLVNMFNNEILNGKKKWYV